MKKTRFIPIFAALMSLYATAVNAQTAQYAPTANDVNPLKVGQTVPDIALTNGDEAPATLHGIIGGNPTLIVFYRGDWCFNCINHFKAEIVPYLGRIGELGYNVAFIGPDDAAHIRTTAGKINVSPSMIWSDSDGKLSVAMGLAWQQQERMLPLLNEHSGGKNPGFVPATSVFVVDGEGKILFEDVRPSAIPADARIKSKLLMAVLENL
jgi:peroxiredoxin